MIIGADSARLAAARALVDGGVSVIVLEARDRIGGRIWTNRTMGMPIDLGASWIHGIQGNPLSTLADKVGAARVTTDYESVALYDQKGVRVDEAVVSATRKNFAALVAAVDAYREEQDGDMPLAKAIAAVRGKIASGDALHRLDFAVHTTIEHEYAASVQALSMQHWDAGDEGAGDDQVFPGGYDQLLTPLAAGVDVRLSQVVTQVQHSDDGCTVHTQGATYRAEQVLVTVPLGVLKAGGVAFVPPLPARKQTAVSRLGFGLLDKLALRFDAPFWPANLMIDRDDAQYGRWAEALNLQPVLGKPILLCFNAADYAQKMQSKSDAEAVADALAALRSVFGVGVPEPKAFLRTRWGADPFARGSYSFLAVGATPDDRDALAEPVGEHLYFAGEATHRGHAGTVHGALLSGKAAAVAMLAA